MKVENLIRFLLAYIFGNISPNNNIRKVAIITSRINLTTEEDILIKMKFPKNANRITIAILIKLFATRIVASNFFGFSSKSETIRIGLEPFSEASSRSDLERENKATSAPEINAEQSKSKNSRARPKINLRSKAIKKNDKLEGSGSNLKLVG